MNRETAKKLLNEQVISTAEVANMLGCTRQYIYKLVKSGKLEPIRILDRDRLFWKDDVLARMKSSKE